jgi:hypothetical protein
MIGHGYCPLKALEKTYLNVSHVKKHVPKMTLTLKHPDNVNILRNFFEHIHKYNMRLNPKKCVFGVESGKPMGSIVSHRGIEVDTNNIDVIINMPPPRNIFKLRSIQGKNQDIHYFIASLADQTLPFTQLLKKEVEFI